MKFQKGDIVRVIYKAGIVYHGAKPGSFGVIVQYVGEVTDKVITVPNAWQIHFDDLLATAKSYCSEDLLVKVPYDPEGRKKTEWKNCDFTPKMIKSKIERDWVLQALSNPFK